MLAGTLAHTLNITDEYQNSVVFRPRYSALRAHLAAVGAVNSWRGVSREPEMLASPLSPWLRAVEQRIREAMMTVGEEHLRSDPLSTNVAASALLFFRNTADLFPAEPLIYPSHRGDLVVEVQGKVGALTTVLSAGFYLMMATVGEKVVEDRINSPTEMNPDAMRARVKAISDFLRTGTHAAVDAAK
jgi:hypothetical protein